MYLTNGHVQHTANIFVCVLGCQGCVHLPGVGRLAGARHEEEDGRQGL